MYKKTPWPYLVQYEPDKARKQILSAYRKAHGNQSKAAEILEIHRNSLQRFESELGLEGELETLRRKLGCKSTRSVLAKLDRSEATKIVTDAMRKAQGSQKLAAEILGVSYRTIVRAVTDLRLDHLKRDLRTRDARAEVAPKRKKNG